MMTRTKWLYVTLLSALSLMLLPTALQAGSLHVVIQGQQQDNNSCPTPPAPCEIVISAGNPPGPGARTYSNITISGKDGTNPAKVSATDDSQDTLELVNATVAPAAGAPLPINNGDVSFWADFTALPTPSALANVQFERTASGNMRRGGNAAKDDWFKVTGWVNDNNTGDNEINTWDQKVVCCLQPLSSGNINLAKSEVWSSGLAGNRVMKAQFWFEQKQSTDRLNIDYVRVRTSAVIEGGERRGERSGVFDCYVEEFIKTRPKELGQCEEQSKPRKGITK